MLWNSSIWGPCLRLDRRRARGLHDQNGRRPGEATTPINFMGFSGGEVAPEPDTVNKGSPWEAITPIND